MLASHPFMTKDLATPPPVSPTSLSLTSGGFWKFLNLILFLECHVSCKHTTSMCRACTTLSRSAIDVFALWMLLWKILQSLPVLWASLTICWVVAMTISTLESTYTIGTRMCISTTCTLCLIGTVSSSVPKLLTVIALYGMSGPFYIYHTHFVLYLKIKVQKIFPKT